MAEDIFKALPVRIFGFGFAASEASRYRFSYKYADFLNKVTVGYVVVHVVHNVITQKSLPALIGTVCFEALCTCIIPPVVTYHFCSLVADLIWSIEGLPNVVRSWTPFVAGILLIPVFYIVVDPAVDEFIQTNIVASLSK